jgi:hypothetical protein
MSSTAAARVQNGIFLGLAFAFLAFAMYPGRFDGDSITAYQRALGFRFVDATSVWVAVLFRALAELARGPGPMFLLQLLVWVGGLAAFTDALIASGGRATGQAISLLAVSPLLSFDFFDVQKDAFLSGLLIVLIAMGGRRLLLGTRFTLASAIAPLFVFLLALDTRHNGVFALFPLWFLFWPVRSPRLRPLLVSAAAGLAVFAAAHLALDVINHGPLRAERKHFAYSLVLYDLAGISARTHSDASEGRVPGLLAATERCYSPHAWDPFSFGACRPTGRAAQALMMRPQSRVDLVSAWARAIVAYPIAYAAHRARHFGCLLSVGCQRQVQLMSAGWWIRPWDEPNMRVAAAARLLGGVAVPMWQSPLGAGSLWLLVLLLEVGAAAWALGGRGFRPIPYLALLVSGSGLAYLLSFALVGIADEMRYLHPIIFLALVALPLTAASFVPDARAPGLKAAAVLSERRRPAEAAAEVGA